MPSKNKDEIIYPFLNFNNVVIEDWEWLSDFNLHFIMDVNTSACMLIHVSKTLAPNVNMHYLGYVE